MTGGSSFFTLTVLLCEMSLLMSFVVVLSSRAFSGLGVGFPHNSPNWNYYQFPKQINKPHLRQTWFLTVNLCSSASSSSAYSYFFSCNKWDPFGQLEPLEYFQVFQNNWIDCSPKHTEHDDILNLPAEHMPAPTRKGD